MTKQFKTYQEASKFAMMGQYPYDDFSFGSNKNYFINQEKGSGYDQLKLNTGDPNDKIVKWELKDFKIIPLTESAKKELKGINHHKKIINNR